MRKRLLTTSLISLVVLFASFTGFAQGLETEQKASGTVIIGTATTTNHNTPFYYYYGYSFTQTLYFQSELNFDDKVIEEIGFQYAGPSSNLEVDIEIYIEHTSLTSLASTVQLGGATKVYDGPFTVNTGEAWSSVSINQFFYNNTDNLLITVLEKRPGWNSPSDVFYATAVPGGNSWCRGVWNDGAPYDPNNLAATSQLDYRANTKIWFADVPVGPAKSEITPLSLNFGDVETSGSKILTVEVKNAGADPLEIAGFTTTNSQFQVVNIAFPLTLGMSEKKTIQVEYTPTTAGQESGVIEFLMDAGIEGDREVQVTGRGQFFQYVVIGTGNYESSNTPIYPWYGFSFTQTLYMQTDVNMPNALIQRIGYQYSGTDTNLEFEIEIWLSHTDITSITASIPLAGFTKVYDGPYIVRAGEEFSWVEISPFFYNNVDNLLITVIEKKPGYTSSTDRFFATEVPAGQNLCVGAWNDGAAYDPNNLPVGSVVGYRANTKLWISGEIPTEPEAKTTPASLYFGEVEATVAKIMNVEVMNMGGGILEITGANVTNPHFLVVNVDFPVLLPLGQKKIFEIQFIPTDPGLEEGLLTFEMDPSVPGSKTVELSGRGLRFGVLREGFENELFPPLGWKVVDNNADNKGWFRNVNFVPTGQTAPRTGVAAASLDVYAGNVGQTSYDDWLITPKMLWQDGDIFNFWIKRLANQNGQIWRVQLSTTGTDPEDFSLIDVITDPPMAYIEKAYDLNNYGLTDGTEFYMAFQFVGLWCWPGVIDDLLGSVMVRYDKDLMTLDFSGPGILHTNVAQNYTVKFANWGFQDISGDSYSIQLCAVVDGVETVFATLPGQNIASSEVKTVTIPLTMTTTGVFGIYGKLVFEADQDISNNTTKVINVDVIPQSFVVKNIGDFPINQQTPFYYLYPINFEDYRKTSLSQTLYFKDELNTGGLIDRIGYYKSFGTDMLEKKVKVWMAEVDVPDLAGVYIPPSQMTLVYEGNVDFLSGIGRSDIMLANPFVYTGNGNLLVTVYYFWGQEANSTSRFAYKEPDWGPQRTRYEYGWQQINPENPGTWMGSTINFPYTTLMFETANGLGNLTGRVLYQSNNAVVQGAKVTIENPAIAGSKATIYTDASGYFTAPYAMAGSNLKVTITKYGYVDLVIDNINLPAGGSVNLGNRYLVASPVVALSGSVIKSDTQTPAEGAVVKIFGMDNYETISDENGLFEFPSVWGLTAYQIEITLDGYQKYEATIQVPGVNHTLDPITLLENAPGPNIVTAVEDGDYAVLSWYGAGEPYPAEFRYDDGVAVGLLITTGNVLFVGGSSWKHNAIIDAVHWFTYQHENYPASDYVLITILGLTPAGAPDPNNILFTQGNVRNDYGWNTFDLPTSIEAPNGFFFGTSAYNNYNVVAYDDGVDEPWVWQGSTQWSNGMGSYFPLENVTSPPLYGNIFIRASGFTYGELETDAMATGTEFQFIDLSKSSSPLLTQSIDPVETGVPAVSLNESPAKNGRPLTHYNVYRKLVSETNWNQLNYEPVIETTFTDYSWATAPLGLYHFAVAAVYTNGVLSQKVESNELEKTFINGQVVELKQGWSAISTYKLLDNPAFEEVFMHHVHYNLVEIVLGKAGFYWPGQNINLLGDWDTYQGYKIKMNVNEAVLMKGQMVTDKTVPLTQGVNYLPVLSDVPVDAELIFNQITNQMLFAFDIVNGLIYWPEGGIFTLNVLESGKSYLLSMIAPGSVTFPEIDGKSTGINQPMVVNDSPWFVQNTGIAHIISIQKEAMDQLKSGDIIALFNSNGTCVGLTQYLSGSSNLSLVVYGNDFTTAAFDGMVEGEPMNFRLYSPATGKETEIEAVWSSVMPNAGLYADYGLSSITGFKLGATGIGDEITGGVSIYPNPATDEVFVVLNCNGLAQIDLLNQFGSLQMTSKTTQQQTRLDVSGLAPGIYLLKATCGNSSTTHKLVIR